MLVFFCAAFRSQHFSYQKYAPEGFDKLQRILINCKKQYKIGRKSVDSIPNQYSICEIKMKKQSNIINF